MATIDILGDVHPADGNTSRVPYSLINTGTTQDLPVWYFANGATGTIKGAFSIPDNWVGSSVLKIQWTSETTSGNVRWEFKHRSMAVGSNLLDTSTTPTEITQTVDTSSKPTSASNLEVDTITLTETDYTAGDLVYFEFSRLGGHANDTKADGASLVRLQFEYA